MALSLKKVHHLIRYFIILGIIVFFGYIKRWRDDVFLVLIGPILYLIFALKEWLGSLSVPLPKSQWANQFGFLLPFCLFYFGLLGFQLKQLWNERGKIRFLSLFALIFFILYIHYEAWGNLSGYFLSPKPPSLRGISLNKRPVLDQPLGDNQSQSIAE